MIIKQYNNPKLTLEIYNKIVSIEWDHNDLDLDELFSGFIGLLKTHTFHDCSIKGKLIQLLEDEYGVNVTIDESEE